MGSLIALHAIASAPRETPPCVALILSSPVARIHHGLSSWRRTALRWGAALFPKLAISLETLSGLHEVQVVKDVVHQEQAATNDYHLPSFSLRLLNTLANMIETLPDQARLIAMPVLLLHGGHDIFSRAEDVEAMAMFFGAPALVQRILYPESYHLLFYDHQREQVLADLTSWLRPPGNETARKAAGP
jgi:alpha-beta hydrolase superfamily lysophospholipase